MKDSFVFYRSFYNAISKVKDKNIKADIYDAICELGLNDNVQELDYSVGAIILELIKPQILANNERYENGKKGGRPKKVENHRLFNKKTIGFENEKPNVNVNANENVNVNENVNANANANGTSADLSVAEENETNADLFIFNDDEETSADLFSFIEEGLGRTLNGIEYEVISSWEDNDLTRYAVKESILNGARGIKYIQTVLSSWESKGLKTVQDVQAYQQKYHKKQNKSEKEIIPEWFDKPVDNQSLSFEEQREMEELINGIAR